MLSEIDGRELEFVLLRSRSQAANRFLAGTIEVGHVDELLRATMMQLLDGAIGHMSLALGQRERIHARLFQGSAQTKHVRLTGADEYDLRTTIGQRRPQRRFALAT